MLMENLASLLHKMCYHGYDDVTMLHRWHRFCCAVGTTESKIVCLLVCLLCGAEGMARETVVVDSVSGRPLSGASVFDRRGAVAGISRSDGRLPYVAPRDYPVTVRYIGYKEAIVNKAGCDTVFMVENAMSLPEVVIESRSHKLLHMLAYVREYSTLTTYSDTVFLFREKMVDFMLSPDPKGRVKGWSNPRVLQSKSYYRFTNSLGLDSVSDRCSHHFSWTDWVGVVPRSKMPPKICRVVNGSDTVRGKYSPTEIWRRKDERIALDVNVLADTTSRKWVPDLSLFFKGNVEFEQFRVRFNYDNIDGDEIAPMDLTGYSFNIESNGRGHGMFRFNRYDEPFFVSTYGEVYIIDKEYITEKEARRWEKLQADTDHLAMYEPAEAPELQPSVQQLVDRVNRLDHDRVRLDFVPDRRLVGRGVVKQNLGQRMLSLLKTATGITAIRARRDWKRQWKNFTREQRHRNAGDSIK